MQILRSELRTRAPFCKFSTLGFSIFNLCHISHALHFALCILHYSLSYIPLFTNKVPMPKTVSAMEVRQNFGLLLNEVALLGDVITIERAGKPIARLVPMDYTEKQLLDFRDIGKLPSEIWTGVDASEYLDETRQDN